MVFAQKMENKGNKSLVWPLPSSLSETVSQLRLASNSLAEDAFEFFKFLFLHFQSDGIMYMHHHDCCMWCHGWNQGFMPARQALYLPTKFQASGPETAFC